jgi:hypothetical protein
MDHIVKYSIEVIVFNLVLLEIKLLFLRSTFASSFKQDKRQTRQTKRMLGSSRRSEER